MKSQDSTAVTRTAEPTGTQRSALVSDRLGRFSVLRQLGSGGMGRIYEAYDSTLDRRIALKLLHTGGDQHRQRLIREAQALARLDHANVVTVYEVGAHDDTLFVAMELMRGGTLKEWSTSNPIGSESRLANAVSLLIDAGQGLVAAHGAGLVHRDVKPSNILLGEDGHAKVADFGIARVLTSRGAEEARLGEEAPSCEDILLGTRAPKAELTSTGVSMGTPAYMAPEQFREDPVDASADQFSFCVTAWEVLFGVRPFSSSGADSTLAAIRKGHLQRPPNVEVHAEIESALRRGLRYRQTSRHQSISAVVNVLRASPSNIGSARPSRSTTTSRIVLGGGATAALLATAIYATQHSQRDPSDICEDAGDPMRETWSESHRALVRQALSASNAPYAESTWSTVQRMLDRHAAGWTWAAENLCSAKLLQHDDGELLERQDLCLESNKRVFTEIVDVLSTPKPGLTQQAVQAVVSLPRTESCLDPRRLSGFSRIRTSEARDALVSARAQVARAQVHGGMGQYDSGLELARSAIGVGTKFDDPGTAAAGFLALGQLEQRKGRSADAEDSLRAAIQLAEVAHDHTARVLALIQLLFVVGRDAERHDEAEALGADARAVLRMLGADPILSANLEMHLGGADRVARELDSALARYESALQTYALVYGEAHPQTGRALTSLGGLHISRGEPEQAIAVLTRARASFEATLGGQHPVVPVVLNNLGTAYKARGDLSAAIRTLERAASLRSETDGADHPGVAKTLFNLGSAQFQARRYEEAIGSLRDGAAILRKTKEPNKTRLGRYDLLIGTSQVNLGRFKDAATTLEPLLKVFPTTRGGPGRFARRTRLFLAIAVLSADVSRARALVQIVGDTVGEEDAEYALLEHLRWLLSTIEYGSPTR